MRLQSTAIFCMNTVATQLLNYFIYNNFFYENLNKGHEISLVEEIVSATEKSMPGLYKVVVE